MPFIVAFVFLVFIFSSPSLVGLLIIYCMAAITWAWLTGRPMRRRP